MGDPNIKYDAIVVGSGISGGWAAKELTERGMTVLMIERGRDVEHQKDYPTEGVSMWDIPTREMVPAKYKEQQAVQATTYAYKATTRHFFANDLENPYQLSNPDDKFNWIRGHQVGGKSLLWARASWRLSEQDFLANNQDGFGAEWPIAYSDLSKWYDHVEEFAGISGSRDGIAEVPDGVYLKPYEMNEAEKDFKARVESTWDNRKVIMGRMAHLSEVKPIHTELGRGQCQGRYKCQRGCSYGAYFSTQSATLPAAQRTGRLKVLPDSLVTKIHYNSDNGRAESVEVVDTKTGKKQDLAASLFFICASTLATTQILLNSKSESFPNGLGNSSGVLGKYLMDHVNGGGATGTHSRLKDSYYRGMRPGNLYIPRFQNLSDTEKNDFLRGYAFIGYVRKKRWTDFNGDPGFGAELKNKIRKPTEWYAWLMGWGETLPNPDNHVTLHPTKTDKWGMPQLVVRYKQSENDKRMLEDMQRTATELLQAGGFENIKPYDYKIPPGNGIHEMGTARMGNDPETSVLNKHNQMHDIPNVFVTDGSAMASSGCNNPSLTYMAMTARACEYAAKMFKLGKL